MPKIKLMYIHIHIIKVLINILLKKNNVFFSFNKFKSYAINLFFLIILLVSITKAQLIHKYSKIDLFYGFVILITIKNPFK